MYRLLEALAASIVQALADVCKIRGSAASTALLRWRNWVHAVTHHDGMHAVS